MSAKLYRIWSWDQNDRSEIARIKAYDFDTVAEFLLAEFIKPEYRDSVDTVDIGLEWMDSEPGKCVEMMINDKCAECPECDSAEVIVSPDTHDEFRCKKCSWNWAPCEYCEGCLTGLQIEEVEHPKAEYGETWDFKTIFGTDEFYDLTGETPKKADDWNPRLTAVWKETPELGGAALIAATVDPELEKGVDPALLRRGREALK